MVEICLTGGYDKDRLFTDLINVKASQDRLDIHSQQYFTSLYQLHEKYSDTDKEDYWTFIVEYTIQNHGPHYVNGFYESVESFSKNLRRGLLDDEEFERFILEHLKSAYETLRYPIESLLRYSSIPTDELLPLEEALADLFYLNYTVKDAFSQYGGKYIFFPDDDFVKKLKTGKKVTFQLPSSDKEITIFKDSKPFDYRKIYGLKGYGEHLEITGQLFLDLKVGQPLISLTSKIDFREYDDKHHLLPIYKIYERYNNPDYYCLYLIERLTEEMLFNENTRNGHFLKDFIWNSSSSMPTPDYTDFLSNILSQEELFHALERIDYSFICLSFSEFILRYQTHYPNSKDNWQSLRRLFNQAKVYAYSDDGWTQDGEADRPIRYAFDSNREALEKFLEFIPMIYRQDVLNRLLSFFYLKSILFKYFPEEMTKLIDLYRARRPRQLAPLGNIDHEYKKINKRAKEFLTQFADWKK